MNIYRFMSTYPVQFWLGFVAIAVFLGWRMSRPSGWVRRLGSRLFPPQSK